MEPKRQQDGVDEGCGACPACSKTPVLAEPALEVSGWPMAVTSVGVFLVPMVFAIIGACVFSADQTARFAGALGGFALALLVMVPTVHWLERRKKKGMHL